jgi:molybdate transport system ATP-binding protein
VIDLAYAVGGFQLEAQLPVEGWTAVFGPSGSGKTSLLECVAGLRAPHRGRIEIAGEVLLDTARGRATPSRARRVGYVSQNGDLFPHLTVRRNLLFGHRGNPPDLAEVAAMLEIDDLLDRYPHQTSGGQRQRVALGRALLSAPRLLLLDEPLSSLDPALRRRLMAYFARVKAAYSTPCLYVTHSVAEVLTLADRVVLLDQGRVVGSGPPSSVLSSMPLADPLEHLAEGIENVLELVVVENLGEEGVTRLDLGGGRILVVPLLSDPPGDSVRISIRADDIIVALGQPGELSAQNAIPARVVEMVDRPPALYVRAKLGEERWLWSHLTPAAVHRMGLTTGMEVTLIIKSHAVRTI